MRKLCFITSAILFITGCKLPEKKEKPKEADTEKIKTEMVEGKRCRFDLPENLMLKDIDPKFDKEGYYKIGSRVSSNVLQLFVFDEAIDPAEKIDAQYAALTSPDIFTPAKTDSVYSLGIYTGRGFIIDGFYKGGVIHGKIKAFSHTEKERGFLVIRQTIDSKDTAEFTIIEKSLRLKEPQADTSSSHF